MDKKEELQKWLNDDRYVQRKELETMWNIGRTGVNEFLKSRNIKPIKVFFVLRGSSVFYDKQQCVNARAIYSAKPQELQKCLNDPNLIQTKELALEWGITKAGASMFVSSRNIKPIKKVNVWGRNRAFYDRAECERARPFINQPKKEVEKVENIGELATATKYQILCETGADNFIWDKVTMKHKIMPVKNYCDERGNFVSLFKKDEAVSAILAYKNEQKQLLEKCLADKNLVTTKDLETIWNCKKSNVYSKIYKLKIKPHVKVRLENGNIWNFYKRSDCFEFCKQTDNSIANNERLMPIENNNYNPDIHVTMKDLMRFTGRSRYMIMQRFINKGIAPVGTPLIGKTVSYVYDLQKALDAVSDVLKPRYRKLLVKKQKEINPMEEKQMELPEPKEQTPDIIPADTIDLFTMSELETEFKNRGVELTDEVKAKINASDMPEMQEIATMIRGNAKTIAIRLSVLNEIAGQLKSVKKLNFYEKMLAKFEPKRSPKPIELERKDDNTVNIAALSKKQALDFIRNRLQFKERIYLRNVTGNHDITKEHRRFDMSGYDDSKCGDCTLHNLAIVNEFADLGIYDYTDYLFLDFYKGQPTLYMRYFKENKHLEFELCGWTTSEIIYFIFQKTILSGKNKRRRD